MSSPESEVFSSLRAVRKVVRPSQSLKEFMQAARLLSDEIDPVPGYLDPLVYACEGLRTTIYLRRLKASEISNNLIRKMYTRMESPMVTTTKKVRQPSGAYRRTQKSRPNMLPGALKDVENIYLDDGQPLTVRSNRIVVSSRSDDERIGSEFALVIDAGSGASVLKAQQDVLKDAEGDIVTGRKLRRLSVGHADALEIPFMRAPLMEDSQREDFIQLLSTELPVFNIEIGPIEWKPSTATYLVD